VTQLLFRNARVFDGTSEDCAEGMYVRVADGLVQELSAKPINAPDARVIDVGGRTLMPGLIDCHVHVYLSEVNIRNLENIPLTLMTARAAPLMVWTRESRSESDASVSVNVGVSASYREAARA
jgi:imidazolonepropionase-like amidohydrolase